MSARPFILCGAVVTSLLGLTSIWAQGSADDELVAAAAFGRKASMEAWLAKGASVNAKDRFSGETALAISIRQGHSELAQLLLAKGADPNAKNAFGWSPLMLAARRGDEKLVRELLAKGVDVNAKNAAGWTARMLAEVNEGNGTTRILAAAKAKRAAADVRLVYSLLALAGKGADPEPALLPYPGRVNAEAALTLEELLAKGVDLNCNDPEGNTPLIYASNAGNHDFVAVLLKKGANPDCKNQYGDVPVFFAAKRGHFAVINALAERADIHRRDRHGDTALMLSAENGHVKIVSHLLARGARINERSTKGMTALMYAARDSHIETVRLLIDKGADASITNNDGEDALSIARDRKADKIAALLREVRGK